MRRTSASAALVAVVALALSACATAPAANRPSTVATAAPHFSPTPPPVEPAPPAPPPPLSQTESLTRLPGWADEDHAAALAAFRASCGAARDEAMKRLCALARAAGPLGPGPAKLFLESHFRAERSDQVGMMTAYFAPEYPARDRPDAEFSAPVRPKPLAGTAYASIPYPPASPPPPPVASSDPIADVLASGVDYPAFEARPAPPPVATIDLSAADRQTIETSPPNGALAWMRPEELFFLQIQGSGTLSFPDGRKLRAAYAGDNGKPFVAIARPMVQAGQLQADKASGDTIRAWLRDHKGAEANAVMWKNPRYVFFSLAADDGQEPAGAAGMPLPAGRAIAIDPSQHAYGEVFWLDAEAPVLAGAFKTYRRLAVALDTGSAIRGQVRADLYLGRGDAAGAEAGRVRHNLKMMRLVPTDSLQTAAVSPDETAPTAR